MSQVLNGRLALVIAALFLLGLSLPVQAHNGAVAIAVPVEGITIDGDLSDWPEEISRYPLHHHNFGVPLREEADFRGIFRVGYSEPENALYVAVEVEDDVLILDPLEGMPDFNAQDGCEIYLDDLHQEDDSVPAEYVIWGRKRRRFYADSPAPWKGVEAEVQCQERACWYEWRIDIDAASDAQVQIQSGTALGFDLAFWDRDQDGSASQVVWGRGRGIQKNIHTNELGDLILVPEIAETGTVRGRIQWEDMEEGTSWGKVRIRSTVSERLWVQLKTDRKGLYEAELPVGTYRVEAGYGRGNRKGTDVEVRAGRVAEVSDIFFSRPPLGRKVEIGTGRPAKAGPGFRRGQWLTLNGEDGLPSVVTSLLQDNEGNLWFGTYGGANRYDGHTVTAFTEVGVRLRPGGHIIEEDRQGNLWFTGLDKGITRYDGQEFTNFSIEDGLPPGQVHCMLEDRHGNLWFGIGSSGVIRYDGERFISLHPVPEYGRVYSMLEDRHGNLWFGIGSSGVIRYDGETVVTFTTEHGLTDNHVSCMLEDQHGNLWFGTGGISRPGKGVSRYDGETFTTFTTRDGLADSTVRCMLEDRHGNLWFGTGKGVSRYDGKQFTTFTTKDGLTNDNVVAVLEDDEGYLWFGTLGGGVSRYDGQQLITFTAKNGLANGEVYSILEDRHGNLWFGAANGASRYDGETFTSFTAERGLTDRAVRSILEDRRGNLWMAASGDGVFRYDGETFTHLMRGDGLASDWVGFVQEDRYGNLWFGTINGASRYDGETFENFTGDQGLVHRWVTSIQEDRDGNLWFATGGGGVSRFDGEGFTTFTTTDGLAHDVVLSALKDRQGNLWFGMHRGISRYDGETFATFTSEHGVPDASVLAILEDQEGHLWFGTQGSGVIRFDGRVFQRLSRRDGLPSDAVWDLYQDRQGDIWLATSGGVVRYSPRRISPPIHLTDVVAARRHGPLSELAIPSSQEMVAFEFASRSLTTPPDQMLYLYHLTGYDKEWQQTRTTRVEYAGLPQGEYVFEVKAVDRDLNYSATPATMILKVHLPYERLGLWVALTVTILLVAWQTTRVIRRDRRLQQVNQALSSANKELFQVNVELQEANNEIQETTRRKSDFLARMSHDLRTPMNAIIGYTRILLRRLRDTIEARQLRNLENIDTSAHNLLNLINEILDLSRVEAGRIDVHPQDVDLKQLAEECAASVESLLSSGVALIQQIDEVPVIHTDPDILRKVLMNLLSNAVKFTDEGSITVSVRPADGWAEISVADTGVGIPAEDLPHIFDEFQQVERQGSAEKEGTGLGLAIAQKSVEMLGGILAAESEVGQGTKFTLRIKDYPSE